VVQRVAICHRACGPRARSREEHLLDGRRFDQLARQLAKPQTRRVALKSLAAGIAGSLLAATGIVDVDAKQRCRKAASVCRKNDDCCSNRCSPPDFTGRRYCTCAQPADCPTPSSGCLEATCTSGVCGTINACTENQVCFGGSCCTPESEDVTCTDACGAQLNNCGQSVDCGECCVEGGGGCSFNSACCSNICIFSTCQGVLSGNGGICDDDADCASGLVCCQSSCRQCCTAFDCPGSDTECQTRTCISNSCGTSDTAAGVAVTAQTAGDCQRSVCDGSGGVTSQDDNADVPASAGECKVGTCINGNPSQGNAELGSVCSTGFCNFEGICSECGLNSNCPTGEICCQSACQPSNNQNCGCQGLVCGETEVCHDDDECVEIGNDPNNCGAVNNECTSGFACCDGTCIDIESDQDHCGACDNECSSGQSCCGGSCTDLGSDVENCGSCDNDCGSGFNCQLGTCVPV
jgi:hypothetical protein